MSTKKKLLKIKYTYNYDKFNCESGVEDNYFVRLMI